MNDERRRSLWPEFLFVVFFPFLSFNSSPSSLLSEDPVIHRAASLIVFSVLCVLKTLPSHVAETQQYDFRRSRSVRSTNPIDNRLSPLRLQTPLRNPSKAIENPAKPLRNLFSVQTDSERKSQLLSLETYWLIEKLNLSD